MTAQTPPKSRSRLAAGAALALLCFLLMLPNIAWLWFSWYHTSALMPYVAFAILLTAGWLALFGSALWIGCLLLIPLAAVMPTQLYYIANFHRPITPAVIDLFMSTSAAVTQRHLSGSLVPLIIACCGSLGVAGVTAWLVRRNGLRWNGHLQRWTACIVVAVLVFPALVGTVFPEVRGPSGQPERAATAWRYEANALSRWVAPGYPFGLPVQVGRFIRYRHVMRSRSLRLAHFRFGAHLQTPLPVRQIYLLVIGESSRRDHWQIFGYPRATNPELSKIPNIVPIRHMVSAFTQTAGALSVALTRKPATQSRTTVWPEASIVRAMSEAGFEIWWISNQTPMGRYDTSTPIMAHEADHVLWLQHGNFAAPGTLDGDLLDPLRKALHSSKANLFLVVHMLGSHQPYDYRYPARFLHFAPTESKCGAKVPRWQCAANSYDNTILYTDHVLARIISMLKASGATTALWYASDHGETLPSRTCHERSHGHENRPGYQIATLFWYSDAYGKAFPDRVAALRAHADSRTMSENEFPSLIDMAGLDFPSHAAHEAWSLFSPKWHFHTRWVDQFYRVDFDHAKVGPGCMKLMPAGYKAP